MTLEELKSLRQGEVVVFTKVDEKICEYHNHQVGDEMTFYEYDITVPGGVINFVRKVDINDSFQLQNEYTNIISHFSYEICHYIERKVKLERDKKLNNLGI
jgi:hypothetical protein